MKSFSEITTILQQQKPLLAEKYGVQIAGVFGSYIRNEQRPDSDVLPVRMQGVGIKSDCVWELVDKVLNRTNMIPGVRTLKVDVRAGEALPVDKEGAQEQGDPDESGEDGPSQESRRSQ